MSQHAHPNRPPLLPLPEKSAEIGTHGICGAQDIKQFLSQSIILASSPITPDQIQPASLDLRLGHYGYRMRASFLPGPRATVKSKIESLALHRFPLEGGAVLETGSVYLLEVQERLALPRNFSALASPKSSIGRLDVFTRLIADYSQSFDAPPAGYEGPLYLEISPRSFGVIARPGTRLSQLRLRKGRAAYDNHRLRRLHKDAPLIAHPQNDETPSAARASWQGRGDASRTAQGLPLSLDLQPLPPDGLVGYRAKRHTPLIDLDKVGAYDPEEFWQPIAAPKDARLILDPDAFYILASREAVRIPPTHAAEMMPFDAQIGEFRVHYAGFFDPGFGAKHGARAVLEVRSRDTPIVLEHGQRIGRLIFERLLAPPPVPYDSYESASYRGQGLALSKHFKKSASSA